MLEYPIMQIYKIFLNKSLMLGGNSMYKTGVLKAVTHPCGFIEVILDYVRIKYPEFLSLKTISHHSACQPPARDDLKKIGGQHLFKSSEYRRGMRILLFFKLADCRCLIEPGMRGNPCRRLLLDIKCTPVRSELPIRIKKR